MKKLSILCCVLFTMIAGMFGQKPDKKYCTTGTYFVAPKTPSNFDVIYFFCQTHLKKIDSYATTGPTDTSNFQAVVDEAMDDVDVIASEGGYYLFSQVDSTLDYSNNEQLVREKVLNQKILDLATPSGRLQARNILYAITVLIEKHPPSSHKGILKNDITRYYYFGWIKLMNGTVVIPYVHCINNTNQYLWEIGVIPATGTIHLQNSYFFGKQ